LALSLGFHATYSKEDLLLSVLAVLPAMLGMWFGQKTRDKIDPMTFRKCFFGALFLIGTYMAVRAGYSLMGR
jgi:uncharacterized membrane protein YfcA